MSTFLRIIPSVIISLFFYTLVYSQSSIPNGIEIQANIIGLEEGRVIYLNKLGQSGIDSCKAQNETISFSYQGEPSIFFIATTPDSGFDPTKDIATAQFFTGETDMHISGHVDSMSSIRIEGSQIHDTLFNFLMEIDNLEYQAKMKMKADLISSSDSIHEIIATSYQDLIRRNSDNYVGIIALWYSVMTEVLSPNEAADLLALFESGFKNTTYYVDTETLLSYSDLHEIGDIAPDFSCESNHGKKIKLSDYRGKYVLLEFWATWCGPCRIENPFIETIYQEFKNNGFEVIGFSLDTNQKTWIETISRDELTWIHISDFNGDRSEICAMYGINSIPSNFLIDPSGRIISKNLRGNELRSTLENIFQ